MGKERDEEGRTQKNAVWARGARPPRGGSRLPIFVRDARPPAPKPGDNNENDHSAAAVRAGHARRLRGSKQIAQIANPNLFGWAVPQ